MHQNKTTERLGEPTLPQRQAKLEWKHFSNLYILFSQEAIYIYIFLFGGGVGGRGGGEGQNHSESFPGLQVCNDCPVWMHHNSANRKVFPWSPEMTQSDDSVLINQKWYSGVSTKFSCEKPSKVTRKKLNFNIAFNSCTFLPCPIRCTNCRHFCVTNTSQLWVRGKITKAFTLLCH